MSESLERHEYRASDGSVVIQLPYGFISERYLIKRSQRSPFSQQATPFEDMVIRVVRYAFAEIPANIGNFESRKANDSRS